MDKTKKNPFGGGNPNSIYTPMSEDEQEVLQRLIAADDLEVHVVGWGKVGKLVGIKFGDLRVSIPLRITFQAPSVWTPIFYFDLELRTRTGLLLFRSRESALYNNEPVLIRAGMYLDMVWDIAIQKMAPELVKLIKPGAIGLTTREGNRTLQGDDAKLLKVLREGEAQVRAKSQQDAAKAAKLEKKALAEHPSEAKILVTVPSKGA